MNECNSANDYKPFDSYNGKKTKNDILYYGKLGNNIILG